MLNKSSKPINYYYITESAATLRSNSLSDQISAMHGNSKNLFHSFQLKKYIPFIHSSSLLNSILPLLLKSLPFNSQILFPSFIHLLFSIQFCLWQLLQGCKHLDQCFGPKLFFFQVSHKFQGVQLKWLTSHNSSSPTLLQRLCKPFWERHWHSYFWLGPQVSGSATKVTHIT